METEKTRVLCLDDNVIIAMELEAILREAKDIQCVGVLGNADNLIEEVRKNQPDVVLLDLTMPGRNPLDALKEISSSTPEVRVIVFSGYDDIATRDEAEEAGAWGFLSKSGDLQDILKLIREAAGKTKDREGNEEGHLWH